MPPEQLGLDFSDYRKLAWPEGSGSKAEPEEQQPATEQITYSRKKKKSHPGRNPLPDHLPVEEVIIEPDEDTEGLVKIGEEISESLDYRPGKLVIIRRIRPKYARPVEKEGEALTEVIVTPLPTRPIDRGIPEPALLAEICVAKYVDHLPIYRQIKRFNRDHGGWLTNLPSTTGLPPAAPCSTRFTRLYSEKSCRPFIYRSMNRRLEYSIAQKKRNTSRIPVYTTPKTSCQN